MFSAVTRLGSRTLRSGPTRPIAVAAFVAIFCFGVPFPGIVHAAGLLGFLGARAGLAAFQPRAGHGVGGVAHVPDADPARRRVGEPFPGRAAGRVPGRCDYPRALARPVTMLAVFVQPGNVFLDVARSLSRMTVVAFGDAYRRTRLCRAGGG